MALGPGLTIQWLTLAALAVPALLMAAGQSGSLSSEERALASFVDAHDDEAIALLEKVVNVNSGTMNLAGVREVGRIFRTELDQLGFRTQWIDQSAVQRAGHLMADHPGPGPRILLIGHLDTVFEKDSPFQRFERIDRTTARGPGIIDMKGGDVVMVQALRALESAGALKSLNIAVALMGDEEEPGQPRSRAREPLVAAARGAEFAIGFEDGDGEPHHAITARRGTTSWELRVTAKSGHSSQIFSEDLGAGAVFEASRVLNACRERLAVEPHLTFNAGLVVGGTTVETDPIQSKGTAAGKTNVVPGEARVLGDLRALTAEQVAKARHVMEEVAAQSLPNTRSTITFDEGYPPLAPAEGNARLLAMYDQASRDLGFPGVTAVSPDRAGAADVSFVAGEVRMILDAVGLKGRADHSFDETADLATLPMQIKRAAVLIARLGRAGTVR